MAPANVVDELDEELVRHAETTLDAAEHVLRGAGLLVERLMLHERAADAIVGTAREWAASLVVLGNRGHSPLASLILGSTSAEVVDRAPCPVLVARDRQVDEVVLGADGSPGAVLAERVLVDWPMFRHLPVSVVSVAATGAPWSPAMAGGLYDPVMASTEDVERRWEITATCDAAEARLTREGLTAVGHVRDGDAAAGIVAFARGRSRPLIVLGSRGLTGLARLLLGGVARNVLHHATGSVLIVRQDVAVDAGQAEEVGQLVGLG
jgi:nucleotide-binding universal stress UspA family protein